MERSQAKIKSLAKGMALLDKLTAAALTNDGMTLSTLAQALSAPRNTAHNLLQTLVACGYARQDDSAQYYLGPKAWQMGTLQQALSGDMTRLAMPVLSEFAHEYHEAAVFTVLVGGRRVVLARVQADQVVSVDSAMVEQAGIYTLPTGRILLSHTDKITRSQIVSNEGWPGPQWDDIDSESKLDDACKAVKAAGYCRIALPGSDLIGLATAVMDAGGRLMGSAGCYAPVFRCDRKKEKSMLDGLRRAAELIATAGNNKPA